MIEEENLDVRTITLGISLLDCIDSDLDRLNEKIYNKNSFIRHTNFINVYYYGVGLKINSERL